MKGSNSIKSKISILTRGDVKVNDIEVGDILCEVDMGRILTSTVVTSPVRKSDGTWTWTSSNNLTGKEIQYLVSEDYPHYAPKLYWDNEYFHVINIE